MTVHAVARAAAAAAGPGLVHRFDYYHLGGAFTREGHDGTLWVRTGSCEVWFTSNRAGPGGTDWHGQWWYDDDDLLHVTFHYAGSAATIRRLHVFHSPMPSVWLSTTKWPTAMIYRGIEPNPPTPPPDRPPMPTRAPPGVPVAPFDSATDASSLERRGYPFWSPNDLVRRFPTADTAPAASWPAPATESAEPPPPTRPPPVHAWLQAPPPPATHPPAWLQVPPPPAAHPPVSPDRAAASSSTSAPTPASTVATLTSPRRRYLANLHKMQATQALADAAWRIHPDPGCDAPPF